MSQTAVATDSFIDSLVDHFSLTYRCAHRNLAGISHEESLLPPQPGGNPVHWVVRHIVGTRDRFLPALGQRAVLTAPAESLRLEELISVYEESHDRLMTGLRSLTDEQLAGKAPFNPGGGPEKTLGPFLTTCAFHEAYHVGQLGILRRILGKAGVL